MGYAMKISKILAGACVSAVLCLQGAAGEGFQLLSPARYDEAARVPDAVLAECALDQYVGEQIGRAVSGRYKGSSVLTSLSGTEPNALRATIVSVDAVPGGVWSGAKTLAVKLELMERGSVVETEVFRRSTTGGAFGGLKGNCTLLERNANTIGKDVVRWLDALAKEKTALEAQSADDQAKAAKRFQLLPVRFASDSEVPEAVRRECKVEPFVTEALHAQVRRRFKNVERLESLEPPPSGQALRVVIRSIEAQGGGTWSGPKTMIVRAEWLDNGVVADSAEFQREAGARAGVLIGLTQTTCSLLDYNAIAIAKEITIWLSNRGKTAEPK
jgi:hypothetical protein